MNEKDIERIVHLHTRLITLKLLPRTGWLQRGMMNVESIAEHTFSVASLALMVGDIHADMDRGRVLAIALLHDIAEALVGDLPFSARRLFGAEAKQQAERRAMIELLEGLPQADEYLALWEEYVEGSSREARLVKQLDRVEMLAQALAYERAGHRAMAEFWEDIDDWWSEEFPAVQAMIKRLISERNSLNGVSNGVSYVASKNGSSNQVRN
jgi:putative hydrolase of HD superfamily